MPVRLISLKSWRFTCTSSPHDLAGLLARIAARSGPLRLPAASPVGADEPAPARGYVPIRYTPSQGGPRNAWYHGPLSTRPRRGHAVLPARSAEDLMPAPPLLPGAVANWLDDLGLLGGVPFNYLVPDEAMLPVESLRFFSLHERWPACLLDGALSIGRVTPADYELDRTLAADLRQSAGDTLSPWVRCLLDPADAADTRALSGVLLRSDAVAGWPGLQIVATSRGGAGHGSGAPRPAVGRHTDLHLRAGDHRGVHPPARGDPALRARRRRGDVAAGPAGGRHHRGRAGSDRRGGRGPGRVGAVRRPHARYAAAGEIRRDTEPPLVEQV